MRQSRFTEEKIIAVLAEQERGMGSAEVCRKYGISSAKFYKWKAKFGGMDVSEARPSSISKVASWPTHDFERPCTLRPAVTAPFREQIEGAI